MIVDKFVFLEFLEKKIFWIFVTMERSILKVTLGKILKKVLNVLYNN